MELRNCKACDKKFLARNTPSRNTRGKYCSKMCKYKHCETYPGFYIEASEEEKLKRLRQNFEKHVIKNENGCWGWKGNLGRLYGTVRFNNKNLGAHRVSWILHNGAIPAKMLICHKCDNPICTKPAHLFLGTYKDNIKDCILKKRNRPPKGEMNSKSKLTENEVKEIKCLLEKSNLSMQNIADLYHVHIVTVHDIKYKKTWKHIGE